MRRLCLRPESSRFREIETIYRQEVNERTVIFRSSNLPSSQQHPVIPSMTVQDGSISSEGKDWLSNVQATTPPVLSGKSKNTTSRPSSTSPNRSINPRKNISAASSLEPRSRQSRKMPPTRKFSRSMPGTNDSGSVARWKTWVAKKVAVTTVSSLDFGRRWSFRTNVASPPKALRAQE